MTNYLLDTNLLINAPDFSLLPQGSNDSRFFTSALCYAELLEGEFSEIPTIVANSIIQFASAYQVLGEGIPFGQREVISYRALCASISASGRKVNRSRRVDMMIAATAHANNLVLATRNIRDFVVVNEIVKVIQL